MITYKTTFGDFETYNILTIIDTHPLEIIDNHVMSTTINST